MQGAQSLLDGLLTPGTEAEKRVALVGLLDLEGEAQAALWREAQRARLADLGNGVYLRGLIELSNCCQKNCLYCGIRRANRAARRYRLSDDGVLAAAIEAHRAGFGSLAIQGGEIQSAAQREGIAGLVRAIMEATDGQMGITLSLGEQPLSTYRLWREAGALRYLLRVESSNARLYHSIHPRDGAHRYARRVQALRDLRSAGYHVGTGVMIGLPGQSLAMLADDLLWMLREDVDMVGLGPFIPHPSTPLGRVTPGIPEPAKRLRVSINMVACLRILMPSINIAATTALQTLHPRGREMALAAGANVLMPNITPGQYRDAYALYAHKPTTAQGHEDLIPSLQRSIEPLGLEIKLHEQGNAPHYVRRMGSK